MASKLRDKSSLKLVPSIKDIARLPVPSLCKPLVPNPFASPRVGSSGGVEEGYSNLPAFSKNGALAVVLPQLSTLNSPA